MPLPAPPPPILCCCWVIRGLFLYTAVRRAEAREEGMRVSGGGGERLRLLRGGGDSPLIEAKLGGGPKLTSRLSPQGSKSLKGSGLSLSRPLLFPCPLLFTLLLLMPPPPPRLSMSKRPPRGCHTGFVTMVVEKEEGGGRRRGPGAFIDGTARAWAEELRGGATLFKGKGPCRDASVRTPALPLLLLPPPFPPLFTLHSANTSTPATRAKTSSPPATTPANTPGLENPM